MRLLLRPRAAARPSVFLLLVLAGILALSGCGGDSAEEELARAREALKSARSEVSAAEQEVAQEEERVAEAREELQEAETDLREARERLRKARAKVDEHTTDALLFRAVQTRLLDDEELDGLAIQAEVSDGVVTLRGDVPAERYSERAVEVASGVPGVDRVEDRLRVEGGGAASGSGEGDSAPESSGKGANGGGGEAQGA